MRGWATFTLREKISSDLAPSFTPLLKSIGQFRCPIGFRKLKKPFYGSRRDAFRERACSIQCRLLLTSSNSPLTSSRDLSLSDSSDRHSFILTVSPSRQTLTNLPIKNLMSTQIGLREPLRESFPMIS